MSKMKFSIIIVVAAAALVSFILAGCPAEYGISVDIKPEGAGSVTGGGTYAQGDLVTVEAEAVEGYQFEKWTANGEELSTGSTYQFEVKEGRQLVAHFVEKLIADENLETAIRDEIDKPEGTITREDMKKITSLEAVDRGIADLSGLQYAANLEKLDLQENAINDLGPLKEIKTLRALALCPQSLEPGDQVELLKQLAGLEQLDIKGMDRFCAVEDLQLMGSTRIFFEDETYVEEILGKPRDVELLKEGYVREPAGFFDLKVVRYPELEMNFISYLGAGPEWTWVRDFDFRFKEVEVFGQEIEGPRGIEVGDSLEEVLNRFPVIYQDRENFRQYGRVTLDNGAVVKLKFSDYIAESPYELFPHHFNFTVYLQDGEVESYHIKHIIYDL